MRTALIIGGPQRFRGGAQVNAVLGRLWRDWLLRSCVVDRRLGFLDRVGGAGTGDWACHDILIGSIRRSYNANVKLAPLAVVFACVALAAHKPQPTPTNKTGNAMVELTATLYADPATIQDLLGSDLGGYYVVLDVRLAPRNGEKVKVLRDDFQLRSDRDGEKSKPFSPSQIAGKGAMIVTPTGNGGNKTGFGIGLGGLGMGTGGTQGVTNTAKMDKGAKNKESPLLGTLKEKMLAEKETDQPASGLLVFPMDPKQKNKDLELTYAGPGSRLTLRFR